MTESTKYNRCSKQVIGNKHNAICCDNCNTWIHLKCSNSGLAKSDFKMLGDNPSDIWYCKKCLQDNFPFAGMDNRRFENFIFSNSIMKEKCEEQLKTVIKDGNFSNICSVCLRQLRIKQIGIPCKQCHCLIHRKCAKFNHNTLKSIREDINSWNCSSCRSLQFPFMNLTDSEINQLTFNSNYNCICKEFSHENALESKTNNDLIEIINLPQLHLNEYSCDHSVDVDEQIDLKCNFDYYNFTN